MKRGRGAVASRRRPDICQSIFLHSQIALRIEDISALRTLIQGWRDRGIRDPRAHLEKHPGILRNTVRSIRVVDVNDFALQLYEARERSELLGPLEYDEESITRVLELVMAISESRRTVESETKALTLRGRVLDILTKTYVPGRGRRVPLCTGERHRHLRLEAAGTGGAGRASPASGRDRQYPRPDISQGHAKQVRAGQSGPKIEVFQDEKFRRFQPSLRTTVLSPFARTESPLQTSCPFLGLFLSAEVCSSNNSDGTSSLFSHNKIRLRRTASMITH